MPDIFELHADVCKTLGSAARLKIIDALGLGELAVTDIARAVRGRKANVSQHLAVMRQRGIVEARRQGVHVYYRLASPKVLEACQLMRQVLLEQIASRGELVAPNEGGAPASGKGGAP
jgi:DNA-binding transcriptional ArsR family regulator